MWNPTHVQITVCRARNLKTKGKSGTNDAYVMIKLGKERFQTSVCERTKEPDWLEQCDFPLSEKNRTIKLKAFHRNLVGLDDFLGQVDLNLDEFQVHERPRARWYPLVGKPGSKSADKSRGQLQVMVSFQVQSLSTSQLTLSRTLSTKSNIKGLSTMRGLASQVGDKLTSQLSAKTPGRVSSLRSGKHRPLSTVIVSSTLNNNNMDEMTTTTAAAAAAGPGPAEDERRVLNSDDDEGDDNDDDDDISSAIDSMSAASKPEEEHLSKTSFLSPSSFKDSQGSDKEPLSSSSLPDDVNLEFTNPHFTPFHDTVRHEPQLSPVSETPAEPDQLPTADRFFPVVDIQSCEQSHDTATTNQDSAAEEEISEQKSDDQTVRNTPQLREADDNAAEAENKWMTDNDNGLGLKTLVSNSLDIVKEATLTDASDQTIKLSPAEEAIVGGETMFFGDSTSAEMSPIPDVCSHILEESTPSVVLEEPSNAVLPTTSRLSELQEATDILKNSSDKDLTIDETLAPENKDKLANEADAVHRTATMCDQQTQTPETPPTATKQTHQLHHRPLSPAIHSEYSTSSQEELMQLVAEQRRQLHERDAHIADLERYIDDLLVKVIDLQPLLLCSPSDDNPPTATSTFSAVNTSSVSNSTANRWTSPFIQRLPPPKPSRVQTATATASTSHRIFPPLRSLQALLK